MKKNFFYFIFIGFSIIGCTHSESKIVFLEKNDTVRDKIVNLENESIWTYEIEGERYSKPLTLEDYYNSSELLSFESVSSLSNLSLPVIPSIKDFASLDISSLSWEFKVFIQKACNSLILGNNQKLSDYFDEDYLFNYVFFMNDLKENWQKNFNVKYPGDNQLFSSYVIGKNFESFDLIQIPVRFYCKNGYIDLLFDISQNKKEIKIQQIEFLKWEIEYGK